MNQVRSNSSIHFFLNFDRSVLGPNGFYTRPIISTLATKPSKVSVYDSLNSYENVFRASLLLRFSSLNVTEVDLPRAINAGDLISICRSKKF